ncbi:TMEM175 family protein [Rathayibacter sp. ZW T2_19]|uniref:TMEM175 family protein n=1 Tax=Rathayibacter rubneri TaxID=2950106 RepID=A0A9X2DZA7_9MICO|nr:TMEM175 family protein [Rathayibacter rubneri]MCM6763071.1 TMEM175 family protein [Rathayibacter rubneri]
MTRTAADRTERGLDRLVDFSDAVTAIAITFLVLPLVDAVEEGGSDGLGPLLADHVGTLSAFVVTFAVIGRLWLVQHAVFEEVRRYSPALVAVDFVWLAAIVLLPFAANLLSSTSTDDPSVVALYIGVIAGASAATLGMRLLLRRDPDLAAPGTRQPLARSVIVLGLLLAALVLAVVVPTVGVLWLLMLLLAEPIERLVRRRRPGPRTRPVRTARGLDRLVGFADATVAIAITLLVLPLVELAPRIAADGGGVAALLDDHLDQVLAFALSFLLIAVFWIPHHRVFELVDDYDGGLARLGLLWLAAVTFLPFATSVIALLPDTRGAIGLYLGTMTVMSGALVLIERHLGRHPALLREGVGEVPLRGALVPFGLLVLALVLAMAVPSLWWLLVLLLQTPVRRLLDVRR